MTPLTAIFQYPNYIASPKSGSIGGTTVLDYSQSTSCPKLQYPDNNPDRNTPTTLNYFLKSLFLKETFSSQEEG